MWFQCNPGRTAKMPKHPAMPSTLRFKKCITSDLWSSSLEEKKAWMLHESLWLDRRSLFVRTANTEVVRPLRIHVISCLSEAPTNCLSSSFLPPPVDPTPLRRGRWTLEIVDFYVEKCPFLWSQFKLQLCWVCKLFKLSDLLQQQPLATSIEQSWVKLLVGCTQLYTGWFRISSSCHE